MSMYMAALILEVLPLAELLQVGYRQVFHLCLLSPSFVEQWRYCDLSGSVLVYGRSRIVYS
jgi:hypothetical protein